MSGNNQQIQNAFSKLARKNPILAAIIVVILVAAVVISWVNSGSLAQNSTTTPSLSAAAPSDTSLQKAEVMRVIDGDTLEVKLPDGTKKHLRLVGVDTPESVAREESRNCEEGHIASDYTKSLVSSGQMVWLQRDISDADQYGRLLRYVWLEQPTDPASHSEMKEKMLNVILIQEGYAQVKHYKPDTTLHSFFKSLGDEAAAQGKGVTRKWA